jgi:hypothetical protein
MANWIKVLRTGAFVDRKGTPVSFDEARLDRIAANYDPAKSETPLVVGHPQHDSPAFGWVEKFKRVGRDLFALPKQVAAEFAEAVNAGRFKYVSCAVRADDTIRHIGFLGAEPPAVKGLGPVMLSEDDEYQEVELAEVDIWTTKNLFQNILRIFRRMREAVIAKLGVEEADRIIPNDTLDYMIRDAENIEQKPTSQFSEPQEGGMDAKTLQQQFEAEQAKTAQLSEQVTTLTNQVTALTQEKETATRAAARKAAGVALSEALSPLVDGGKVTPFQRDVAAQLAECLHGLAEIELSEGEGDQAAKVKKTPVQYLQDLLSSLPKQVELGEVATGARAARPVDMTNGDDIESRAREYMLSEEKKGHAVGVADAVHFVTRNAK